MFKPYDKGSSVEIQGLTIHIPPYGYGCHCVTGETAIVDVIKRSPKAKEQYWEFQPLPEDFEERVAIEQERQLHNPMYIDFDLERIREREWRRREYGVWLWVKGKPIYLTGLNYFFLNYWPLDTGLPNFRKIDVEYFYFWQYCVEDPMCYGMIEVRKRRDGKSFRAGCMLYECISRTSSAIGGIQSKTKDDAAEFFEKTIVSQFKGLPSFFIPIWDTASTLTTNLPFYKPSKKGKLAQKSFKGKELKSLIDFRDSKPKAYDGTKTKRLVLDESGKVEHDVIKRHLIVQHCCLDQMGNIIGKMLVTSTCEEIGVKQRFNVLWRWSDQNNREKHGGTKSGLYKFFMPADRAGAYDIYGDEMREVTLEKIMSKRESLRDDPDDLIEYMRKEPLTEHEAFLVPSAECVFSQMKLNEQLQFLSWAKNLTTRGNFVWEDGKKYTKVRWIPDPKGRWEVSYLPPEEETNQVERIGSMYAPANKMNFCAGADPYDYNKTSSNKRSQGTVYVKWKWSIHNQDHPNNGSLVVRYSNRPATADLYYDDVVKTLWYYGAELLAERNRYGLVKYMINEGLSQFLIYLPGEKEPGIYASNESNMELTRVTEDHINRYISKVYFTNLIEQWLEFDPNETEKSDEAMGAGYALMADKYRVINREVGQMTDVSNFFRKHKIA